MGTHGRNFLKVQREVISRTTREVVLFYYASWKGGRRYKTWKRKARRSSAEPADCNNASATLHSYGLDSHCR